MNHDSGSAKRIEPEILKPKDSGVRQHFDSGSQRDTRDGKGRFDLLPARAMKLVAMHFENGAKKYDERNWEKGQPLSRYIDSALRHIFAHLEGKRDEPHLIAAAWNILCCIDTEVRVGAGLLPEALADLPEALADLPEPVFCLSEASLRNAFDQMWPQAERIEELKMKEQV